MRKLRFYLVVLIFGYLGPVHGEKKPNSSKEAPNVSPVKATVLVGPENFEIEKNTTKLNDKVKGDCKHTDYRSYVECLLEESKRKKRQGYLQQPQICYGNGCQSTNQQPCIGVGCLQLGQQQCSGQGCVQTLQQPCSGPGCVFFGYNCGGTGCSQIGQNCYGVGCVPQCSGSPCITPTPVPVPAPISIPTEPKIPPVDDTIRREIGFLRDELGEVKTQNEELIRATEQATNFIRQLLNRPLPEPKIIREPVLVGHNATTSIDINNYLNHNNVVNVPERKTEVNVQRGNTSHCCIVVRPKTCRRTSKPPYISCTHKRHRTCGSHCSTRRVVYSHVEPGCTGEKDENCVSYHTHPYRPTHTGYQTSGYYPPPQIYYPTIAPQYYPIYTAPPQYPIYAQPQYYTSHEEAEDCEDCESEVETEECDETDEDCIRDARRDFGEHSRYRRYRNVPLGEIREVKKKSATIKRSEDELATHKEAVELEKIRDKSDKEGKSSTNIKTNDEGAEVTGSATPKPSLMDAKSK